MSVARLLAGLCLIAAAPLLTAADFEKFLLADADAFIVVNVRQLVGSEVYSKHYQGMVKDWLKEPGEAQKALVAMGIDPAKDIDYLALINGESLYKVEKKIVGNKLDVERQTSIFLLAEGRFNPAKVKSWADGAKGIVKVHPGGIYELDAGRPVFAALLNPSVAAFSFTREPIAEALEKAAGKRKTIAKYATVFSAAAKLDPRRSVTVYASGNMLYGLDLDFIKKGNKIVEQPFKLTLAYSGIDGIRGGIDVTDSVTADLVVNVKDAATGKAVAESLAKDQSDTVELAFSAVLKYKAVAPLFDLVKGIKTETPNARTVNIKSAVSPEELARSLK